MIQRIYGRSGIEKRHTVVENLKDTVDGTPASTRVRNDAYVTHAKLLFPEVARRVFAGVHGIDASQVTHVITVSCTGFFAPGPDYVVVRALNLPASTQRFHLGFMGCYAAFPALKMAQAFCLADPQSVVLVVCLELCSLHLQRSDTPDALTAASLFADGAAAALVSAKPPKNLSQAMKMGAMTTTLTPSGESDMAWTIGDTGFDMILSSYVPSIIETHILEALQPMLNHSNLTPGDIRHWAIHPGGRSILDKLQSGLGLSDHQMNYSRNVLRDFGNMSSATVLFVLKQILESTSPGENENVCAMAFGPGLTIETGMFVKNAC